MKQLVSKFIADESGATAIEYGLIAAGIAIVIIAAMQVLGPQIKDTFTSVSNDLKDPNPLNAAPAS